MTKRNTKRMAKRVTAAALSVILASSGMVIAPEADAAAKPTLASVAKVAVQKTSKLSVKANGFQIKKVTAKSANVKIATVKVTGGDISITGKKAGKTVITTTVDAVKDSKKQIFNYKTKVTVQDDGSVVVNTQKELNAALKKKNLKKLTIGKNAKSLTIPKGKYKKTELKVNAPKASIVNKGSFKSIEIQAIAPNTWTEDAENDEIRITTVTAFHFIASENAKINNLIVSGDAQAEGNIEIAGSITTMAMETKMVIKVNTGGSANLSNINVSRASSFMIHVSGNSAVGVLTVTAKGANIGVNAGANSSIGTIDVKAEASSGADAAEGEKTKIEVKAEGNAKVENIKTAAENTTVDITADGASTVSNVKVEGKGEASVSGTSENTTTIDVKDAASDAKVVVNTPTVKVETKEGTDTDKIVNNQSGQSIQTETTKADGTVETGTKPSTVPATTPTTPSTTPTTPTTPAQTDPAVGGGGSGGGGSGSGGGGGYGGGGSSTTQTGLKSANFVAVNAIDLDFYTLNSFSPDKLSIVKDDDNKPVTVNSCWWFAENKVRVTIQGCFENGATYRVKYDGKTSAFKAVFGEPTSVAILTKEIRQYANTRVDYAIFDAKGVDITAAMLGYKGLNLEIEVPRGKRDDDWWTDGAGRFFMYMDEINAKKTVNITCTYNGKTFKHSTEITCVENPDKMFILDGNGKSISGHPRASCPADKNGYLPDQMRYSLYSGTENDKGELVKLYFLTGWSSDKEGNSPVDINSLQITGHTTLYAQWKELTAGDGGINEPVIWHDADIVRKDKEIVIDDLRGGLYSENAEKAPEFTAVALNKNADRSTIAKFNDQTILNANTSWTKATFTSGGGVKRWTATLEKDSEGKAIDNSKIYVVYARVPGADGNYTIALDQVTVERYLTVNPEIKWKENVKVHRNGDWAGDYQAHSDKYLVFPDSLKVFCSGTLIENYIMGFTGPWWEDERDYVGISIRPNDDYTRFSECILGEYQGCPVIIQIPAENIV